MAQSTSDNAKFIRHRLRPEANPLDYRQLNSSQSEAFRRIIYMIDEAVRDLGSQQTPLGELVEFGRASRSAFLTGDRGLGKSSVLLSLIRHTIADSDEATFEDAAGVGRPRLIEAVSHLKRRVVWLKPIDMEPLPTPFSLLASLLIRIQEAFERVLRKPSVERYGRGVESTFTEVMQELETLQSDIALAWSSNLDERRGRLDPDSYTIEVMRTARARLDLSARLDRMLDRISRQLFPTSMVENPLFVVTIDDFDMHPSSCLHVLRLLRMLSIPRLFFLMLGDMRPLEMMLNLQISSELGSLVHGEADSLLAWQPSDLAGEAAAIAATFRSAWAEVIGLQHIVFVLVSFRRRSDERVGSQQTRVVAIARVILCLCLLTEDAETRMKQHVRHQLQSLAANPRLLFIGHDVLGKRDRQIVQNLDQRVRPGVSRTQPPA